MVQLHLGIGHHNDSKDESKLAFDETYLENYDYGSEPSLSEEEKLRRSKLGFKIKRFLWDSVDKSPEERRFLAKLDFFLLSSSMLGYFIKYLNQANINSAYINGMKEDLELNGSQFNYMQTLWTVGYIIGQVPSNLILHRISARYYLGGLELIWATLTICTTAVTKAEHLYAIRFFVGLTESGFFPGMEYLVGSWYSKEEITKRSAFFACAGTAGQMVTGFLVTAIINGIGKTNTTYPPWKWLFVFDAVISYPVGIYTMCVDPNTPSTCTAWYLTPREKEIAIERRKRIGAQLNTRQPYTWTKIKSILNTWHIWVFPVLFLCYNNSGNAPGQPTFSGWLKYSLGMSQEHYNMYPTSASGASIAFALVCSYLADYFDGRTYPFVYLYFFITLFGCICLSIWNIPTGLHWFAYYAITIPSTMGQPMIFCWVNRLLFYDDQKRNLTVAATNVLAYVTNAWLPIFTWNATDLPEYHVGFTFTSCLLSFGIIMTTIAVAFTIRDERREEARRQLHKSQDLETKVGTKISAVEVSDNDDEKLC